MFLICGEALYDLFGEAGSGDSTSFDARIGGSPFNVAMGLARLEQEVAFFGGISTDALGEKLIAKFRSEGVSPEYILRSDHLTTLSLVQKDDQGQPAYTFYGAEAADRMVTASDLPSFHSAPDFLHIGSYTALVEPVASALKALIERERAHTLISFDPNIRPTVVPDMTLWRDNTHALVPFTDVVKVSDEDLDLIAPGESIEHVARKWLDLGAALVIVTKGADGAEAFTPTVHTGCPGVEVKVEDTVGAGDTFQASLLAGLKKVGASKRFELASLDESGLKGLLTFAVNAAAITCSRRGADLPRLNELGKDWLALN